MPWDRCVTARLIWPFGTCTMAVTLEGAMRNKTRGLSAVVLWPHRLKGGEAIIAWPFGIHFLASPLTHTARQAFHKSRISFFSM